MEILRIPSSYLTQIKYLSDKDSKYVLETLFWLASDSVANIEDSMRWWLVLSMWREAVNMENKARAKKWEKGLEIDTATLMCDNVERQWESLKKSKVKKNKIKENKEIILSKESEQSSKTDNRILEIDLIIEALKEINWWIIDDKVKQQRIYWKHIKNKMDKIVWFNWDYVWFIKYAYENSDEYRKQYFRSAEKFYYNIAWIISWIKTQLNTNKVIDYWLI